jgi:hypothetical protein
VEPAKQEPPKIKHDGIQRFNMTKEEWRQRADKITARELAEWERSRNQKSPVAVERADSADGEKSKSPRFVNSLEPRPDGKVHYSPAYPQTTPEGDPIESSPSKSGNKTSPTPESDAESVKSVLAQMASRSSIVPSSEGLLGFPDDNGCIIWIKTSKREEGLVTEFLKRDRVIATFDEGALKAELKKAGM